MVTKDKPKGPIVFKQLTPEEQIAEIRKEAALKIKELEGQLPWEKRFTIAFDNYVKKFARAVAKNIKGDRVHDDFIIDTNNYLVKSNFKVKYESASFDSDIYNKSEIDRDCALIEYPVYVVLGVQDTEKQTLGYIQINCNYSPYNGNKYSSWFFVKPKQITCTVYNAYKP